jgi:anion-transporting  ArsA/GET3 family ATPase
MDNQHKKIKGYIDLSQEEIDLMNEAKELAEKVGDYIEKLENKSIILELDERWLTNGKIQLQSGFMKIIRSIAKPTTF